tara:strand:- start:543 stop:1148 length:606 start_codon:yes stop_codon:yes gene_type:complete
MTFYDKSIIYKIKHNEDYDDTNIYVGSTSNFKQRKYNHKNRCNNEKDKKHNLPVYQYIRDNGGWDNFVMIPIEQYPCNNKNELEIKERHHIDILRPTLNMKIPSRTKKEYYEDNKEQIEEWKKQYYEENKAKITEYKKQYHDVNRELIKEQKKIYYEKNKDQILEYQKEKVICDHCGCEVRKNGLNRHQKTNKCINFVKTE